MTFIFFTALVQFLVAEAFTVITAFPAFFTVTTPVLLTVAILILLEE